METYFRDGLRKTSDFSVVAIPDISRNADKEAIANLFELIAAAAVICDNRAEFVGRIMNMPGHSQLEMKHIIEAGMDRLEDCEALMNEDGEDHEDDFEDGGENELVFDQNMDGYDSFEDSSVGHESSALLGSAAGASSAELMDVIRERDEFRDALDGASKELTSLKNERSYGVEEIEVDNRRLREMTSDLQERLERYQKALETTEQDASKAKRQLEEATAVAEGLREKNVQLEDELDLAKAKTTQLHKAEATVIAYKKKLNSVGVMNQQMQEMEDQAAGYLRQIVDLENANKQLPGLQRKVETMQEQIRKLEQMLRESSKALTEKNSEVTKLKADVMAAVNAKKLFEDELSELRARHAHGIVEDDTIPSFSLGATNTAQLKEKIFRLEHENESLRKQVEDVQPGANDGVNALMSRDIKAELERKDSKIRLLSQDKAKLEAYSKQTLAKFQEKYMVALQECKKQLKEKSEKIEQLEMRAAVEKAAQKREEQLLSSSMYELGLSILQNNLAQR